MDRLIGLIGMKPIELALYVLVLMIPMLIINFIFDWRMGLFVLVAMIGTGALIVWALKLK